MTGNEIARIRYSLGISATKLAQAVGVTPSSWWRWESYGAANVPLDERSYGVLLKLQDEVETREKRGETAEDIGEVIGKALLVGGALFAAYKLLETLFEKK